jgi:hypothetical protein
LDHQELSFELEEASEVNPLEGLFADILLFIRNDLRGLQTDDVVQLLKQSRISNHGFQKQI